MAKPDPSAPPIRLEFPDWIEPMAATLTQERFTGADWTFERKFDGIRLIAFKQGDDVRLYSRTRQPQDLPGRRRGRSPRCRSHDVILDGEMTWDRGTRVSRVRRRSGSTAATSRGCRSPSAARCSTTLPLARAAASRPALDDAEPWERACAEGWEGVIAKRLDSPYEQKRSKHWLKMKCELTHDFVVGGFTDPQGGRVGLGALLVGYFEGDDFVFAGKVGTGFDTKLLDRAARAPRRARAREDAVHEGDGTAARARALGAAGDRRARRVHRMDGAREAAPLATARASEPTSAARRRASDVERAGSSITHPEKVMFPDDGITKGELAAYYAARRAGHAAASRGRPVTMERFHRGIGDEGLLSEERRARARRRGSRRVAVPKKDGVVNYPVVRDERGLLWLANQNCITPHVWTSRVPDLLHPDLCVFDLDPLEDDLPTCCARRRCCCATCSPSSDVTSWVKTSGSKGFHVAFRSTASRTAAQVARFAHAVGRELVRARSGRISRRSSTRPIAADAFSSTRAATSSARRMPRRTPCARSPARRCRRPCTWDEVESGDAGPQTFTLRTMAERLDARGDLWGNIFQARTSLPAAP